MVGFDVFNIYNSFLIYSKTDYDIIKYNFKTRITQDKFVKSNFKYQFMAFEKNHDRNYAITYFWFVHKYHKHHLFKQPISKYLTNLFDSYRNDMLKLVSKEMKTLTKSDLNRGILWPKVVEEYKSGMVSLETILFLEIKGTKYINEYIPDDVDPSWESIRKELNFDKFFIGILCNDMMTSK